MSVRIRPRDEEARRGLAQLFAQLTESSPWQPVWEDADPALTELAEEVVAEDSAIAGVLSTLGGGAAAEVDLRANRALENAVKKVQNGSTRDPSTLRVLDRAAELATLRRKIVELTVQHR
jgi:hypothetical protein